MPPEIGLTAKIRPELDKRKTRREASKLESHVMDKLTNIAVSADFSQMTSDLKGIRKRVNNIFSTTRSLSVQADFPTPPMAYEASSPFGGPGPTGAGGEGMGGGKGPGHPGGIDDIIQRIVDMGMAGRRALEDASIRDMLPSIAGGGGDRDPRGWKERLFGEIGTEAGFLGGVAITGTALDYLNNIANALDRSSPTFNVMTDMLGMALQLFFRPFGRALGLYIIPAMKSLLSMMVEFNRLAEGEGVLNAFVEILPDLAKGIGYAVAYAMADILLAVGDFIMSGIVEGVKGIFFTGVGLIVSPLETITGLIEGLMDIIEVIASPMEGISQAIRDRFGFPDNKPGKLVGSTARIGAYGGAAIGATVGSVVGPGGTIVGSILGAIVGIIVGLVAGVAAGKFLDPLINSFVNLAVDFFTSLFDMLKDVLDPRNLLPSSFVGGGGGGIPLMLSPLSTQTEILDEVNSHLKTIVDMLVWPLSGIIDIMEFAFGGLILLASYILSGKAWDDLKQKLGEVWDVFRSSVESSIPDLSTINLWDYIIIGTKNIWNFLTTGGRDLWNWLTSGVGNAGERFWAWLTSKSANLWSWLSKEPANLWSWLTRAPANLWNWLTEGMDNAGHLFWSWLKGGFEAGEDLWNWLKGGVNNVGDRLWNWLTSGTNDVKERFLRWLGIERGGDDDDGGGGGFTFPWKAVGAGAFGLGASALALKKGKIPPSVKRAAPGIFQKGGGMLRGAIASGGRGVINAGRLGIRGFPFFGPLMEAGMVKGGKGMMRGGGLLRGVMKRMLFGRQGTVGAFGSMARRGTPGLIGRGRGVIGRVGAGIARRGIGKRLIGGAAKYGGKALGPAALLATYAPEAYRKSRGGFTAPEVGGLAGAIGGGVLGAKGGAVAGGALGTAIAPGVGTAIGAGAGGIGGFAVGATVGRKKLRGFGQWVKEVNSFSEAIGDVADKIREMKLTKLIEKMFPMITPTMILADMSLPDITAKQVLDRMNWPDISAYLDIGNNNRSRWGKSGGWRSSRNKPTVTEMDRHENAVMSYRDSLRGGAGGDNAVWKWTGLAEGGVVTAPTTAIIGEGREDEAVMPLSKLDNMLNTTRNINIDVSTVVESNANEQGIERAENIRTERELRKSLNNMENVLTNILTELQRSEEISLNLDSREMDKETTSAATRYRISRQVTE